MIEQLKAALKRPPLQACSGKGSKIWSFRFRPFSVVDFFLRHRHANAIYFQDRSKNFLFGLEQADVFEIDPCKHPAEIICALDHFQKKINEEPLQLRWMGGISFEAFPQGSRLFPPAKALCFTLPRILIKKMDGAYSLYLQGKKKEPLEIVLREAVEKLEKIENHQSFIPRSKDPRIYSRVDFPNKKKWSTMVKRAYKKMAQGEMEKCVLGRFSKIHCTETLNPGFLLNTYENEPGYRYVHSEKTGKTFFSFSPEPLFEWRHGRYKTESIAGTKPRGETKQEEERFERELHTSKKEIHEHAIVSRYIKEKLNHKKNRIEEKKTVLKLKHVQHLKTELKAPLNSPPLVFLRDMHPTPALGGVPREKATAFIKEIEPYSRGWFGAPLGYVAKDQAEFMVGIRSVWIEGNTFYLFAGCGIVEGSDADEEWAELEKKIALYTKLFSKETI